MLSVCFMYRPFGHGALKHVLIYFVCNTFSLNISSNYITNQLVIIAVLAMLLLSLVQQRGRLVRAVDVGNAAGSELRVGLLALKALLGGVADGDAGHS